MEALAPTAKQGKLYLIPCPLSENAPMEVLPITVKQAMEPILHYVVENEKAARKFIKNIHPRKPQSELQLFPLNKFTDPVEIQNYLDPITAGHNMGILSDAGCPGVADPGAAIVAMAHQKNIEVVPLVGPSSILLSLMASGMNGQSFAFNGYLPIENHARKRAIKKFEKRSTDFDQTQLFIETPYRNNQLLKDFLQHLHPECQLSVACDLNHPNAFIRTLTVKEWKKVKVDLHKRPAVFSIHFSLAI